MSHSTGEHAKEPRLQIVKIESVTNRLEGLIFIGSSRNQEKNLGFMIFFTQYLKKCLPVLHKTKLLWFTVTYLSLCYRESLRSRYVVKKLQIVMLNYVLIYGL